MIQATHYFASFLRCNSTVIKNFEKVKSCVEKGILESGATIIGCVDKQLENNIYSLVFLLQDAECSNNFGHSSIHTHPENRMMFIDFLMCGCNCNYNNFEKWIVNDLDPGEIVYDFSIRNERHVFL